MSETRDDLATAEQITQALASEPLVSELSRRAATPGVTYTDQQVADLIRDRFSEGSTRHGHR
jgi:hypothetical protein